MKKFLIALLGVGLSFTMVACGEDTNDNSGDVALSADETAVATAKTRLVLTGLTDEVISDFSLILSAYGDVDVSYTSSNEDVISIDGDTAKVTRPAEGEANATVKITATLTKGTATDTKEFTGIVIAEPESTKVTLANALTYATGEVINVSEGTILVAGVVKYGFYITNNEGDYVFVNSNANHPADLAIGDAVTVKGTRSTQTSRPQITMDSMIVTGATDTVDANVQTATMAELQALTATDGSIYGTYNISGILQVTSDGSYDTTTLTSLEGDLVFTFHYHSTDLDNIAEFDGQEISLNVVTNCWYTNGWSLYYFGDGSDVTVINANPVLPEAPVAPVATLNELLTGADNLGEYTIENVSLVANVYNGAVLTDGTNFIFAFKSGGYNIFTEGEEYTIEGEFSSNYNQPQLKTVTIVEKTSDTVTTTPIAAVNKTVEELAALSSSSNASYSLYNVTGTVASVDGGYYLQSGSASVKLSYDSSTDVASLVGTEVSMNVFVGSYYSSSSSWTVYLLDVVTE